METCIHSQFGYCPLTWMFCGRKANSRINHLHERALRIVLKNRDLSFDGLLKKDVFKIYHRKIQILSIELFKLKNGLLSEILNNIFDKCQIVNCNLRSQTDFFAPNVKTSLELRLEYFKMFWCQSVG